MWKKNSKHTYDESLDIVHNLLISRGIEDNDFLKPSLDKQLSPYGLANIEDVANRIVKAINNKEKIAISNDVDPDGITSSVYLSKYLNNFTDNHYIMYHQRSKGHGIQNQMKQITDDTDLVVILDSSSNEIEALKQINNKNIDIVIIDHHDMETHEAYDYALIVNPNGKCDYKNKQISTAGLIYKVCTVIDDILEVNYADEYLDLSTLGLVSDMMDLSELDNRAMISYGLDNIKNKALRYVFKKERIDLKKVSTNNLSFSISPLFNASARLEKIELAIQLLLTDDDSKIEKIYNELKTMNGKRKDKQVKLSKEYLDLIDINDKFAIVLSETQQQTAGYNGLVANEIANKLHKPALVMVKNSDGLYQGSGRSYNNFACKTFLNESGLVEYAKGHEGAFGVGVKEENVNQLKEYINNNISDDLFKKEYNYDFELDVKYITRAMIEEVEEFDRSTGFGFPSARFSVTNIMAIEKQVLGSNRNTIKLMCDGINLMKFRVDENYADDVYPFADIEVIGQLNLNKWYNGRETIETLQVFIDDYKVI